MQNDGPKGQISVAEEKNIFSTQRPRLSAADIVPTLKSRQLLISAPSSAGQFPPSSACEIKIDSRQVAEGDLFIAYRGITDDGHRHIPAALARGARHIIYEDASYPADERAHFYLTTDSRGAWAVLSAQACGNPQQRLTVLGVTGTNGKSSTVWMMGQLLKHAGVAHMILGTLGAEIWTAQVKQSLPTLHTTPDPDQLYPLLQTAADQGCRVVAMEVASHSIMHSKLIPIRFSAAAFTSFSRDHLDAHPTLDHYWQTKVRLFQELMADSGGRKGLTKVFFNSGLPRRPDPIPATLEPVVYGIGSDKTATQWRGWEHVAIDQVETGPNGSKFNLNQGNVHRQVMIPYMGEHACENWLAAWLLTQVVGTSGQRLPSVWHDQQPLNLNWMVQVPGRMELVTTDAEGGDPLALHAPKIFVDYAHTPDSLEKALTLLTKVMANHGRLWVVFGCGGDRDRGKRSEMGRIADRIADRIVVTSDNPRHEEPIDIIRQITEARPDSPKLTTIVDRKNAIDYAVGEAGHEDLILVAGKGHEDYQIIGEEKRSFDDRLVSRCALQKRLRGC